MKIIVSLSTIPSRIRHIEPVIRSLINQSVPPDEIHIQLPKYCIKEQRGYDIPAFFKDYEQLIVNVPDKDLGSSTKWFYPLQYLKNENNTFLIIVDDDCSYQEDSIELLLKRLSEDENCCYCYTGGIIPRLPQKVSNFSVSNISINNTLSIIENNNSDIKVDTIQGFSMFILSPFWFRNFDYSIFDSLSILDQSDDILISGILEFHNISRIQLGPYKLPEILSHNQLNAIHVDEKRFLRITINAIEFLQIHLSIWQDVKCQPQNLFQK